MILSLLNKLPVIDQSSVIAPSACICGEVIIGNNVRIMHGAQIIAESTPITIGDNCIVLENAVIRGTYGFPVEIGTNCLIGPNAHLAGCKIGKNVFLATGVSIFHGAVVEDGAEVRINAVVHIKSHVSKNMVVPIGWIAVGKPAKLFPPDKHDEIWEIQQSLDFNRSVYGVENKESLNNMPEICRVMAERLRVLFDDSDTE